jgi:hypothetical protein
MTAVQVQKTAVQDADDSCTGRDDSCRAVAAADRCANSNYSMFPGAWPRNTRVGATFYISRLKHTPYKKNIRYT